MNGYVKQVQNWLSQEFPDYFSETGKYPILPDGIAGQSTMNALTMALQITVDVTEIDGEWNQELSEKCPIVNAVSVPNVIRIAQGCLTVKAIMIMALMENLLSVLKQTLNHLSRI